MIKNIRITDLELNRGQIAGLPKNPRTIKDERFKALKKSIEDAPEMLALRELLVFPHNGKFVVIGGNMRLKACRELGYKELPCKVIDENTPVEKLREYTIKDNISFGTDDWGALADWDSTSLSDWGMLLVADNKNDGKLEKKEVQPFKKSFVLVEVGLQDMSDVVEVMQKALIDFDVVITNSSN